MATREFPLIRKIVQTASIGNPHTNMIATRVKRACHHEPDSSCLQQPRTLPKRCIQQRNFAQTTNPATRPSHCHSAAPPIRALAQAGNASIQRIGTTRSSPIGELEKAS
jgi:hypothetical protein